MEQPARIVPAGVVVDGLLAGFDRGIFPRGRRLTGNGTRHVDGQAKCQEEDCWVLIGLAGASSLMGIWHGWKLSK